MRYYFDVDTKEGLVSDDCGSECASHSAVERLALESLIEIAADKLDSNEPSTFSISVRDDAGKAIYRARLFVESVWLIN